MTCGIYKIENKINGKIYIGQSVNIERRWKDHRVRSKYKNEILYDDIREYGIENFNWIIIEECNKTELKNKEKYYIKLYNSLYPYGYNKALGSGTPIKLNYEQAKEIKKALKETNETEISLAKKYKVHKNMITGINVGRFWFDENINYPIRPMAFLFCKKCGGKIHSHNISGLCIKCYNESRRNNSKINSKITKEELKKLIREYSFLQIGKMFNVTDNAIRKWCDHYNLPKHSREIKKITDEEWDKL